MKANQIKKGNVIALDGQNYIVTDVQVQSTSARSGNTLYKITARNVVNKQKIEKSYKGDENLAEVEFSKRAVQLLFNDGSSTTFMDNETYEQFSMDNELLEYEKNYLIEGIEGLYALVADESILGIELPATVALEIVDTSPAIKGASASARTKPATLSTGLVVQVPEYLSPGEVIKINTASAEFISRA